MNLLQNKTFQNREILVEKKQFCACVVNRYELMRRRRNMYCIPSCRKFHVKNSHVKINP